ncbi:MAG: hypothetical protein JST54_34315 [Deltaproteobacteria bacterium]|nr:hypothetical protein [Deltaproteobacteria bacterium]
MPKTTILDNDYATLWHHPESKIVHHQFKRFIHGEEFRQVLRRGQALMEEHKATKWLSDDRANSALPADDEKWAQAEWFPKVQAAGWKYWAIVLPEKIVGQMNMKRFADMYKDLGITAKMFSKPEDALLWLELQ